MCPGALDRIGNTVPKGGQGDRRAGAFYLVTKAARSPAFSSRLAMWVQGANAPLTTDDARKLRKFAVYVPHEIGARGFRG